jgi:hypothetical protein
MLKTFSYAEEGLAYTVNIYEDPENAGQFLADITVDEGAMDVNAIYLGDDDASGDSEMLNGPLNMNGATTSDGEQVQWDQAVELSRPGLGSEGEDKETYVTAGDTLTLELDIASLDEIGVFGIRATSTTTEEGSIKAVSDMPEEPEDPEDPEEPVYDKLGFGVEVDENGGITNGIFVRDEDLPEGQDPTFENYVNYYESEFGEDPEYNVSQLETVVVYDVTEETDEAGNILEIPEELFRIDAPDGGFQDAEELIAAHDTLIDDVSPADTETGSDDGADLMAALSLGDFAETDVPEQDADLLEEDDLEMI